VRLRTALSMATLFLFCFTLAVWSAPLNAEVPMKAGPDPELNTAAGQFVSLGDADFAVVVKHGQKEIKLRFLFDGHTKFEGRLTIGSYGTVEYHPEDDNNIATHVSVLPASGLHAY
jgi:hypothetical protein